MSLGMILLVVLALLSLFGVLQRVLDRMALTDRQALFLVALIFAGGWLPDLRLGMVSVNIGGALVPFGVCVYLFFHAGTGKERIRCLIASVLTAAVIYVIYLLIKALRKYTKSEPVRRAKAEDAKTLGEVLKKRRMDCKMTQEFVAETLGVSRQAVSKWESGASDPSTTNLMALAKLFGTTAEELLKETK